jgi:hypothetical protein
MTNQTKFKVVKISIVGRDGWLDDPVKLPIDFIGDEAWQQANAYLRYRAVTTPIIEGRRGYEDIDFFLEFDNQNSYGRGTYSVHRNDSPCLATHIISCQSEYLTAKKISLFSDEEWAGMQNRAKDFLDNYELKQNIGYCRKTLISFLGMALEHPMLYKYQSDEKGPVEFHLQGVPVWIKIEYKNQQGTPSQIYAQSNKIYYFADSFAGEYHRYLKDAESDGEVVRFAKEFFVKSV